MTGRITKTGAVTLSWKLIHDSLSGEPHNPMCECGHGRDEHHGPVEKYGLECFPCECGCPEFSEKVRI